MLHNKLNLFDLLCFVSIVSHANKISQDSIEDRLLGIELRLEEIRGSQDVTSEFAETRILIRRLEKMLIKIDDKISKQKQNIH